MVRRRRFPLSLRRPQTHSDFDIWHKWEHFGGFTPGKWD
jgi:hypothetical protein